MAFPKGHKFAKGRPVGSVNRRTLMVAETAERLECDPFEILMLFAKGDWQALGYDSSVIVKESSSGEGTFMEYTISPELRASCAEKACKYLYPQKKSIEHTQPSIIEGMTPQEKLEAMKEAVRLMEIQLSKSIEGK